MNYNFKLDYVSCLKLWSKHELCYKDVIVLVILLVIIVWWCYSPCLVELWFDGKTLMIDYEEDLVSLRIFYLHFQLWLIVVKSWYYIWSMPYIRIIGGMMLNLIVLTMFCGWLRCMWYNDGENYQCSLIFYEKLKC